MAMAQVSLLHIKYALEQAGCVCLCVNGLLIIEHLRTGRILKVRADPIYIAKEEAERILGHAGLCFQDFLIYNSGKWSPP